MIEGGIMHQGVSPNCKDQELATTAPSVLDSDSVATMKPGVSKVGKNGQLTAEAQIPCNSVADGAAMTKARKCKRKRRKALKIDADQRQIAAELSPPASDTQ